MAFERELRRNILRGGRKVTTRTCITVVMLDVAIAESKITSQGQISIPAEVRRRLGVGPGSTLIWDEQDGRIVVTRAKKFTSEDIRKALFPDGPPKRQSLEELKEGIREYVRNKHARHRH